MKILSLSIRNFRVFESADIEFPESGVVGIIGQNGHGKSSILEAIAWALYGAEATRGTMAGLRWNRAPARRTAVADLVFEVGGQRYCVRRTESDATLVELHDGFETVIAAGTKPVNARIPELLGMSYREWSTTYLCQQRDLARLASMGPTARQQFMREVLGVSRIDDALKACRERKNAIGTELEGVRAGLGDRAPLEAERTQSMAAWQEIEQHDMPRAVQAAQAAEAAATAATEALAASDLRRRRHEDLTGRLESAHHHATEAESSIEALDRGIAEARAARARVDAEDGRLQQLPVLRAEREDLRVAEARAASRASLEQRLTEIAGQCAKLDSQIATADRTIAQHDAAAWERLKTDYRDAHTKHDQTRTERIRQHAEHEAAHKAARRRLTTIQQQRDAITGAGERGACPTCTRVLGDQYTAVLATLQRDHDDAAAEMTATHAAMAELQEPSDDESMLEAAVIDLKARGEAAQRRKLEADDAIRHRADWTEERSSLQRSAADVATELAALPQAARDGRIDVVLAEIATLEELDRSLSGARHLAGRIPVLTEQRDGWTQRLELARQKEADTRSEIVRLQFDASSHAALDAADLAALTARSDAREQLIRVEQSLAAARRQLELADAALARYDARAVQMQTLEREHATHTAAADRLNALRVWAAGQIRPELEELTSGFVALLTDGRHEAVTIGEDFSVTLHESGVPVEIVSGGTEDVAAIALRLAVSQMIAERAGHPLSLLILDEVFGSLDSIRRSNVLSLIRRLSGVFEQVILISHIDETRHAVDHVISVEYNEGEGKSTIIQPALVAAENRAEVAA